VRNETELIYLEYLAAAEKCIGVRSVMYILNILAETTSLYLQRSHRYGISKNVFLSEPPYDLHTNHSDDDANSSSMNHAVVSCNRQHVRLSKCASTTVKGA